MTTPRLSGARVSPLAAPPEDSPFRPVGHDHLIVRGAREHNLKDISVELPRDSLICFTGLSGSGKSSLAFDTIFAEGQRRYVESLSSYARQFLGQMDKPDVDFIEGLSRRSPSTRSRPTATPGRRSARSPRSTTTSGCCSPAPAARTARSAARRSRGRAHSRSSTGCSSCRTAPDSRCSRRSSRAERASTSTSSASCRPRVLAGAGRRRGRVADRAPKLEKKLKHTIEVVVDRLVAKGPASSDTGAKRRLTDSVETALNLAGGVLLIEFVDVDPAHPGAVRERRFSERMACPNDHPIAIDEIEPRSFSFNAPYGACPRCTGIGTELEVDPELLVPDDDLSLGEGAIAPWSQGSGSADYFLRVIAALGEDLRFSMDTPWKALPERAKEALLYGENYKVHVKYRNRYGRDRSYTTGFEGVVPFVKRRHAETDSDWSRERYEGYMREVPCPQCQGARLKPEILAVLVGGKNISEICALAINEAAAFLADVDFSVRERQIAERVIKEIEARLGFLLDVGLDYLSLDRPAGTLSGGEAQRIRLATQIGSGLVGVLYVLDEPSIGLHQRDNHRLIETLTRLRDLGNTLIVVEHDEDTIETADWVVDIGPGAGEHGGQVVHSGTVAGLLAHPDSITGEYLSGRREIAVPPVRRPRATARWSPSSADGRTTCRTSPCRSRSARWWRSRACPGPASRRW